MARASWRFRRGWFRVILRLSFLLCWLTAPRLASGEFDFERFQGAIERDELERLLDELYAPNAEWERWIDLGDDVAEFRMDSNVTFRLRYGDRKIGRREEGPQGVDVLKVALDPGHIGGEWAEMEERSFSVGEGTVVKEGDLTLAVAKRVAMHFEGTDVSISLVRDEAKPVTEKRPTDFLEETKGMQDAEVVREHAEWLFYRIAEIRARSERVNERIRPDFVVALHINAEEWPDPEAPSLVERNDGHILVNGCYLDGELERSDVRREMLWRLLNRYHETERAISHIFARAMREATDLPPSEYEGPNAVPVSEDGYVWARNLLANRIYDCPVIYLEPWIANSEEVYPWAAAGDFEGTKRIGNRERPSLPAVYASFVIRAIERVSRAR